MNTVEGIYARNSRRNMCLPERRMRETISMIDAIKEANRAGRKAMILEFKRQSPSGFRGGLVETPEEFALKIGKSADAISILTEPDHFRGSLEDGVILQKLNKPMLMKDFVDRESMVDAAYRSGFDAFLLIADFLDENRIKDLCRYGEDRGMEILVEFHSISAFQKIPEMEGVMIGYNRRDLRSLRIDPHEEEALKLMEDRAGTKILESGINRSNAEKLIKMPFDACLIGTSVLDDTNFLKEIKEIEGNYHDE
ncbi:MAG: indole-3-glycerol-phosphate synthase TrpC [Candidatus Thermoplasmatota archaeon]|nr:indole-3-glycerol-phosphate synthase TrpC [Candidatus Thermoplasmatota archaeon]MCL5791341.1 indole-3-glycerol-phosphate synthase TrpC [Candidatus Thermoplasmatota archaeon]